VLTEQQLADSVRTALAQAGSIREVKMFGGIGLERKEKEKENDQTF
jgi:TfoX/Sxy family transcriptional regulator of competence genes